MATANLELKAYEILKAKLGTQEAETVIEYIESKVEKSVERNVKHLATKQDLAELETKLTKAIYLVGLIQFLAIVGSVVGLASFLLKK